MSWESVPQGRLMCDFEGASAPQKCVLTRRVSSQEHDADEAVCVVTVQLENSHLSLRLGFNSSRVTAYRSQVNIMLKS